MMKYGCLDISYCAPGNVDIAIAGLKEMYGQPETRWKLTTKDELFESDEPQNIIIMEKKGNEIMLAVIKAWSVPNKKSKRYKETKEGKK